MTRTNKVSEKQQEPKWFTHHGYHDSDPTKVKKDGAGKNNWGQPGDELDKDEFNFNKSAGRRNSNHALNEERLNNLNDKLDEEMLKD
ncbi:ATPase stabilizing factor 15 kDa protein [Spathaspora passalidarum NRRL Y-27907]|uniref:ATPase stabilizing factor 15 kDa protein n=1 Tax=Spathaspora passalidarum (strain NRRL Y-27907 / 11-Y1) TaxID=619300 RepID=G3AKB7_SPAPN|nr:ATPase stabilizing factor 15 kDa protein [Spathaspora passalidarum NRRL Y-27907]EGW33576.1 ATPase stabilizing factor 15 kDa protein [Spathaspora passalidarum NRRL Y-27907]